MGGGGKGEGGKERGEAGWVPGGLTGIGAPGVGPQPGSGYSRPCAVLRQAKEPWKSGAGEAEGGNVCMWHVRGKG